MTEEQWTPILTAAGLGLVAGIGFVLASRRGEQLPDPIVAQKEDLERQKEILYEAIRQARQDSVVLGAEGADLIRLELEAARVLQELERLAPSPPKAPRVDTVASRYPQLTGAFWGGLVMLFVGLIWSGLQNHATPRAAGASITGGNGGGMGGAASAGGGAAAGGAASTSAPTLSPEEQAELTKLADAAKANPGDLSAQNAYAHALIRTNQLMEAWTLSEAVVKLDDQNPEARTHQGIVLLAIGEMDMAKGVLDKVIAVKPDQAEALAYRGLLHYRNQEFPEAVAVWEKAIQAEPSQEPMLKPLIEIARDPSKAAAFMAQQGRSAGNGSPSSAQTSAPADPATAIQGEVKFPAGVPIKAGTTLFLSARAAGVTRGPPMAAKKISLQGTETTLTFSLGPEDNPMGGSLSGELVVTARVDADGDPISRSPEDLQGQSATVTPGTKGIVIELAAN